MSEFKGTPGPWKAENGRVYCSDATGSIVAQCCDFKWVPRMVVEEDANARLIAAAPDLLRVLAEYAVLGHGKCTIGKPLSDMARAAIAKALGEDQQ